MTNLPPNSLALELREELVQSCAELLCGKQTVGVILSGGVDTGVVLAACHEAHKRNPTQNKPITVAVSVFASREAPDRDFAKRLALEYNIKQHVCLETNGNELLNASLASVVTALESFDPMNCRNALVIDCAMQCCLSRFPEVDLWLNGDGADELFGGYSFTWQTLDSAEWKQKRDEMCSQWMFAGDQLAENKGLCVKSPFRTKRVVQFAFEKCGREDCIGDRWIFAGVNDEPQFRQTGKMVLRDAFQENTSAYRRKDPIEVGAGCEEFRSSGAEAFFKQRIVSPLTEAADVGIRRFRDAEHRVYFDAFWKQFPNFTGMQVRRRDNEEEGVAYCTNCQCQLTTSTELFCRTCGEYPAQ